MMKVIFVSPYNPLWTDELNLIAEGINASVISFGDLLRQEVKSGSEIGVKLNSALASGELISGELTGRLFAQTFLRKDSSMILTNLPLTKSLVTVFTNLINKENSDADVKLLVVESDKHQIFRRIETQLPTGILTESKIINTVESYYGENGLLSGAKRLSMLSGIEFLEYSSRENAVADLHA